MTIFSHYRLAALASVAVLALAVSSSPATATTAKPATAPMSTTASAKTTHGTASVAYAGSLELWAATDLGPKFEAATGDGFQGRAAGSSTLASEILGERDLARGLHVGRQEEHQEALAGEESKFVIQLATDPLVVAYNPNGRFAKQFNAIADHKASLSSLFTLMSSPGIRIGRTDPNADPQGVYFILMMELAQSTLHLSYDPATTVLGVTKSTPFGLPAQMVDEDSLITDLQAGEFDASSAYLTQAIQYHLHYIALPPSLNFGSARRWPLLEGQHQAHQRDRRPGRPDHLEHHPCPTRQRQERSLDGQPGRRRCLRRLDTFFSRARPAEEGRLPAHSPGLHRCHERGHCR